MKKILIIALILVIIGLGLVYMGGPYMTMITGKPFYLLPPSPKKIGQVGIEILGAQGVYAGEGEWENKKSDFLEEIKTVNNEEDLREILSRAIKVAGGKHSFVIKTKTQEEMELSYEKPETKFEDGILYVKLPAFMSTNELANEYANIIANSFKEEGIKGVIVDLRENGGGNMYPMILGLSPITPHEEILTFVGKEGQDGMTIKVIDGTYESFKNIKIDNKEKLEDIKIAVLVGDKTASSGEMTLMSFAGMDNVKVFGKDTAGYTSANSIINISDETQLVLTVSFVKDRTGKVYEEAPMSPDVNSDTPLEDGIKWINE